MDESPPSASELNTENEKRPFLPVAVETEHIIE